jgi:hypothetical protein
MDETLDEGEMIFRETELAQVSHIASGIDESKDDALAFDRRREDANVHVPARDRDPETAFPRHAMRRGVEAGQPLHVRDERLRTVTVQAPPGKKHAIDAKANDERLPIRLEVHVGRAGLEGVAQ